MEKYCGSCSGSDYHHIMDTWSKKGNLYPSDFDPFNSLNWKKEGFCCCSKNATYDSSWTRAGNVTPDNSALYHTNIIKSRPIKPQDQIKERYNNTYARSDQTWIHQKAYTSN